MRKGILACALVTAALSMKTLKHFLTPPSYHDSYLPNISVLGVENLGGDEKYLSLQNLDVTSY